MRKTAETERRQGVLTMVLAALIILLLTVVCAGRTYAAPALKLDRDKVTLYLSGEKTARLTATVSGKTVKPKYSSSSKRVATVNGSGKITAKHAGTCTITARYGKKKARCRVTVRKKTAAYAKAIQKYNSFLMQPYVTYTSGGARGQADNFFSLDLDGNGIPELFAAVASGPDRWYVLYHISGGKINFGQRIGAATVFTWYPNAKVLAYRTYSNGRSYYHYAKYEDGELYDEALVTQYRNRTTYTADGERVSALEFRSAVDHDLLNYEGGRRITPYVNTPQNRKAYLK